MDEIVEISQFLCLFDLLKNKATDEYRQKLARIWKIPTSIMQTYEIAEQLTKSSEAAKGYHDSIQCLPDTQLLRELKIFLIDRALQAYDLKEKLRNNSRSNLDEILQEKRKSKNDIKV